MLSFVSYLSESTGTYPGNYVCAYTTKPIIPDALLPKSGKRPEDNYHITLIYSPNSNVDQRIVQNSLSQAPRNLELDYNHFDCFDSIPKDGERDQEKATLVLKVNSKEAEYLHLAMKNLGMEHTYKEYSPHVTIAYDVDRDEAYDYMLRLNQWLMELPIERKLVTTHYESKPIDKDWVSKL